VLFVRSFVAPLSFCLVQCRLLFVCRREVSGIKLDDRQTKFSQVRFCLSFPTKDGTQHVENANFKLRKNKLRSNLIKGIFVRPISRNPLTLLCFCQQMLISLMSSRVGKSSRLSHVFQRFLELFFDSYFSQAQPPAEMNKATHEALKVTFTHFLLIIAALPSVPIFSFFFFLRYHCRLLKFLI